MVILNFKFYKVM